MKDGKLSYDSEFAGLTTRALLSEVKGSKKVPRAIRVYWGLIWAKHADLFWILHRMRSTHLEVRDDLLYREYTGLDIQLWHTVFRSLLDHVAELIQEIPKKKKQSPPSFTSLYNDCRNPAKARLRGLIGPRLHSIVSMMSWYEVLLNVRDGIVHRAALTLVFPQREEGILFQVYEGKTSPAISLPREFMFNKNIAYFEQYAAAMISELLLFLEFISKYIVVRYSIPDSGGVQSFHPGFEVYIAWAEQTLKSRTKPAVAN